MENLKLNETPVRTAKNFRINNIKLENIEIPEVIPEFENVTITGDTSKIDIEQNADNIDINLAYGLSEGLAVQVKAQANQKIKLNIKGTQNEKSKTENLEKAEAEIDFKFDDENSVLVDDIEITATENTKSTVVIKYTSNQESENYHNGIIKAKAEKDSELNIVLINLMNTKSNNFLAIENDFEENAKINYTIIDFGGKNSITNYYSNLKGDNCDNQLNTIYLGKENIEIQNRPMPELDDYDVLIKNTKQSLKSLLLEIKSQNLKSVNVFIHTLVLQLEIQNEQEQLVDFLNI